MIEGKTGECRWACRGGAAVAAAAAVADAVQLKAGSPLDSPLTGGQAAITLPTREVYLKGPGIIFKGNPKNYLTEIQLPLGAS